MTNKSVLTWNRLKIPFFLFTSTTDECKAVPHKCLGITVYPRFYELIGSQNNYFVITEVRYNRTPSKAKRQFCSKRRLNYKRDFVMTDFVKLGLTEQRRRSFDEKDCERYVSTYNLRRVHYVQGRTEYAHSFCYVRINASIPARHQR